MRTFILLAVVALASAGSSGYTYEQASNGGYAAGGGSVGSSFGGGSIGGGSFGGGSVGGGSFGGGSVGGGSFGGGSLGGSSHGIGGSSLGGSSHGAGDYDSGRVGSAGPAELNKEFFTFSAPEGEFDDGQSLGDLAQSLKKNLRVIFIRAPENNGLSEAALNLAKSAGDSKTAIYVLTKQGDIGDLANKLQNLNNRNANKPEVHFVKYRTPEDAANAQHQIQSQYDRLGGSSQSHNGGVAPVLDFASKGHSQHGGSSGGISAPTNSYIPPAGPSATYLPIVKF